MALRGERVDEAMFLTLKVLHFDSAVILDRDTAYPLLCGQDQKDRCLERVGNDETTGSKVDAKLFARQRGERRHVARKVPSNDLAREYPEATAVDHFSLGKSWINCKPAARSQKLVDWTASIRSRPSVVHLRLHAGPGGKVRRAATRKS